MQKLQSDAIINNPTKLRIQVIMWQVFRKILAVFSILKLFYYMSMASTIESYLQNKTFNQLISNWALRACKYLQVKIKRIPSNFQVRNQKTIFLVNHRSQADFFIHPVILGGKINFLARRQVGIMFGIVSFCALKMLWFFNRSGHVNVQKFNEWLDTKFKQSPVPSLVVYPQGHRMYDIKQVDKTKIKRGMIKYAYSRQIPVQFVMSFGNENAFNQKKLKISYGEEISYKIGKTIDPKDYTESKQFIDDVIDEFVRFFDETLKDSQEQFKKQDFTERLFAAIDFKKQ